MTLLRSRLCRLWRYAAEDLTLLLQNPALFCCAQAGTDYFTANGHTLKGRFLHLVVNTERIIRHEALHAAR